MGEMNAKSGEGDMLVVVTSLFAHDLVLLEENIEIL